MINMKLEIKSMQWYLEQFEAMNLTPKQKWPVYNKFIEGVVSNHNFTDHEKVIGVMNINAALKESLKRERERQLKGEDRA